MGQIFHPYEPEQALLLPPSLGDWLPAGHLAHFVSDSVEQLDLTAWYARYAQREDGRGQLAYEPRLMVKLLIYAYAVPVFVFLGITSTIAAHVAGQASPGALYMLGVTLIAGFLATTASVIVGFYSAVATYRFGLDPDNHGIPLGSSLMDLVGSICLILVIAALGIHGPHV